MGILELTPSIRADTEAFEKALDALNLTRTQFNRKLKRLGISLGDPYSKTNYMNKLLRDAGKSELQYKNVISKNRPKLTSKGKVEVGMGGKEPGTRGAPANEKIWRDGAKIQKVAEKKFKNLTDQRKFFVETMKKIYKNVPKSQILHIFKNIIRGIKSFSPIGLGADLYMQMIEKNPELLNILNNQQVPMANKGGMMDINEMTRPLGYSHGGISDIEMQKRANYFDLRRDEFMALEEYLLSGLSDKDLGNAEGGMIGYNLGGPAGMTDLERTGYDRSKSGAWNLNDLMRDAGSDIVSGIKSKGQGILDLIKGKEPDKDPLLIKRDAIITRLNQAVENKVMDPYEAAEIIDSITGSRPLNADLINQLYEEYSIGE